MVSWKFETIIPSTAADVFAAAVETLCPAVASFEIPGSTLRRVEGYALDMPQHAEVTAAMAIAAARAGITEPNFTCVPLPDSDWVADNQASFQPLHVGRYFVKPSHFARMPPHGAIVLAVDAGAHMFSAVAFWPGKEPLDVLISNGLATMAFALPAGLAAALYDPKRGAVAMTGDGGLMMCMGELVTAAQQNAKLTTIVFNDGALSLIDIKRQEMQMPDLGFTWERPDFAAAARGFGCSAWRVSTEEALDSALQAAAASDGPCLIDHFLDHGGRATGEILSPLGGGLVLRYLYRNYGQFDFAGEVESKPR